MDATAVVGNASDAKGELTVGERLEELLFAFHDAYKQYKGLRYSIFPYPDAIELTRSRASAWLRLLKKHDPAGPHEWEPTPLNNTLGLVWHESGDEATFRAAFRHFTGLGTEAFRLFAETDDDLPEDDGDRGWLHLLWQWSFLCPTAFVRQESGIWERGNDIAEDDFCDLIEERTACEGVDLPAHSFFVTFAHDLFFVSANAIEMFLRPYECGFLDSCPEMPWMMKAILANRGLLNWTASEICGSDLKRRVLDLDQVLEGDLTPQWNPPWLSYRGHRIKKPRSHGKDCLAILNAFEDAGWPRFAIPSPLVERATTHHGRQGDYERTRKAVYALNRGQQGPFRISFVTTRCGANICWEVQSVV